MPAASTSTPSVQVLGFDDSSRLTRCDRLICDFCSSGQCFACGFLQIPPRGGHPCRPASGSPCRAHRGLTPPSHPASTTCTGTAPFKALRAMPGAPNKNAGTRPALSVAARALPAEHALLEVLVGRVGTDPELQQGAMEIVVGDRALVPAVVGNPDAFPGNVVD